LGGRRAGSEYNEVIVTTVEVNTEVLRKTQNYLVI